MKSAARGLEEQRHEELRSSECAVRAPAARTATGQQIDQFKHQKTSAMSKYASLPDIVSHPSSVHFFIPSLLTPSGSAS